MLVHSYDDGMGMRRILRVGDDDYSLATEAPFASEAELHEAVARHPEVLPADELGLGTLVNVAVELDLGAGPIDMLGLDAAGHVVIVEFKRGSDNPDVRRVVAQMLDYGSALWRTPYDELERGCAANGALTADDLVEHMTNHLSHLDEDFDAEVFRTGLDATLESGGFVFLYVARDLDTKTRRVMTYLGEGPRLSVFAVEVDNFTFETGDAVMVPRVGFVPSWVAGGPTQPRPVRQRLADLLAAADDAVHEVDRRLTTLAGELGALVVDTEKARNYRPTRAEMAIALYPHWRSVSVYLRALRDHGQDDDAERLRAVIGAIDTQRTPASDDPSIDVDALLGQWERAERELLRPFLRARLEHANRSTEAALDH